MYHFLCSGLRCDSSNNLVRWNQEFISHKDSTYAPSPLCNRSPQNRIGRQGKKTTTLLFVQNWTQKGDQDTLRLFLRSMTISYALFFLTVGPGDSWFLPFLLNSHPLQTGEFYCPTSQGLVVPHFLFTIHEGTSCYKCADRYRDTDSWTQDHKRGISQIEKSYKMFTVPLPYCPSEQQWKWKSLSHVRLFVTPWTIQSMEFSRPECWSGLPCRLPHCRRILYQLSHKGSHG